MTENSKNNQTKPPLTYYGGGQKTEVLTMNYTLNVVKQLTLF